MNCHDDSHSRSTYGDEVLHRCNSCGASLMDESIRFGEYVVKDVALKVKLLEVFNRHASPDVHHRDGVHVVGLDQAQLLGDLEGVTGGCVLRMDSMDEELRVRISQSLLASQKRDNRSGMEDPGAVCDNIDGKAAQKIEKHQSGFRASTVRGHEKIKRLWLLVTDRFRNLGDQEVHRLTGNVVEKVNVECLHLNSLANVKAHPPLGARANVERGVEVELS